jgi:pheromone a factor receptor
MRWDILVAALAFPSFMLSIPPLIAHIRGTNFAATVLILTTMILNLQNFVNALIWPTNDVEDSWDGRIFCDIEVKLSIGLPMGTIGAITSILRQTTIILDTNSITLSPSPKQRIRKAIFEGTVCVILPAIMMATHYVVQTQRYWILPVVGCRAAFDTTWLTTILIFLPPTLVCIPGSIYCIMIVLRMWKQRNEIASALGLPVTATASHSRFTRLSNLALTLFLLYFPLGLYSLLLSWLGPRHPFSWDFIHPPHWKDSIYKISGAPFIPIDRWLHVAVGYLCFAFFGVGNETIEVCQSWVKWTWLGLRKLASLGTT